MYLDMHSHCLPGLDDGAKDLDEALAMLRLYDENQFHAVIATPHYHYHRGSATPEQIRQAAGQLQAAAEEQNIPVQIYTGNEIYYNRDVADLLTQGRLLTLAGSHYVLIEFSPDDTYQNIRDGLHDVEGAGFYPILAHAERIWTLVEHSGQLAALVDRGYYIQMNISSVKTRSTHAVKRFMLDAAKNDLIHFLATDAHECDSRTPQITADARYLMRKLGEPYMEEILIDNPQKIITDTII